MKSVVVCGKNIKVEEEYVGKRMVKRKVARASMTGWYSLERQYNSHFNAPLT